MKVKHENLPHCERCDRFMDDAHPVLRAWLKNVRSEFLEAHVSCSFRNEKDQNDAFARGASKAKWPHSKHNFLPSRAIDLFELTEYGVARFDPMWYAKLWRTCKTDDLTWAGNWKTFKETAHFQLVEEIQQP